MAKKCKFCGAEQKNDAVLCTQCNKSLPKTQPKEKFPKVGKMGIIALSILLVVGGLFLFLPKGEQSADLGLSEELVDHEEPILYVNGNEQMKLMMSGMETPVVLGSGEFIKTTMSSPVIRSEDSKNIVYINSNSELCLIPVEKAKKGVSEPDFVVAKNVAEILSFAPDNSDIVYYIEKETNDFYSYDGTDNKLISETYLLLPADSEFSLFYALNDNRIIYYEEGIYPTLYTEIVGKEGSKAELDNVQTIGLLRPEDEGFFFINANKALICYYDFATGEVTELFDSKESGETPWFSGDGSTIIAEKSGVLENKSEIPRERPETEVVVDGEEPLDLTSGNKEEYTYDLYYSHKKDKQIIAEDVLAGTYASEEGTYVIYSKLDGDDTVSYYQKPIGGQETKLFTVAKETKVAYVEGIGTNQFAVSHPNEDEETTTNILYTVGDGQEILSSVVMDEASYMLTPYTVNGHFVIQKDLVEHEVSEGMLLSTDLYVFKNEQLELIGKDVELFSLGRVYGVEYSDSVLFFIANVHLEEGLSVGTLSMYNGETVVEISSQFPVPQPQSMMAVFYVHPQQIYFFTYASPQAQRPDLYLYSGKGEIRLLEEQVLGVI